MTTKLLEIRDRGTFIPAIAIRLDPTCEADRYLLDRAGFGQNPALQRKYVLMAKLEGGKITYDSAHWFADGTRTMAVAHGYVIGQFDELNSGGVIDVEFILGETQTKKRSESEWTLL